jgi:chemotaxis response regulator CheB
VAAAGKTSRKAIPSTARAKNKGAKRQSAKGVLPPAKPTPLTDLSSEPPGFLIVGIGPSAGGLEAMEEFFLHMLSSSEMIPLRTM